MLKNDESPLAVGKRLKVLRVMAGLNRHALAEQAEVSKTSISYWEHGKGGPMTLRSMGKIIDAIEKIGIKCSEEWLRTGNGTQPTPLNQIKPFSFNKKIQTNFDQYDSPFLEEINLFLSTCKETENAVIAKIENNAMNPIFEKEDVISGLFVSADTFDLSKEKICIVMINNKLDVRRVRKGSQPSCFNLSYLSYDPQWIHPFEINDIQLDFLAPVLRLWRE